jgi:Transposase DDE domain group 1
MAAADHPLGEHAEVDPEPEGGPVAVDTFGGRVHVEWDPQAPVTPLGQLPFFIEYLRLGGLFDPWVADCPLGYTSPNAPKARDVLGTVLLSVLAGHRRYAHITSLRADGVNPALLGMTKVVSEDAVRRALAKIDEAAGLAWLERHLDYGIGPLLSEPWILDVDTTIKPLYGHQEGAELGYNPHKPGRPSHVYHSYMIGELRLALAVEVQSGKHHASKHAAPGLWSLLGRLGRERWPTLLRGDIGWASEANMRRAEQEGLPYLFKLRTTRNVKRLLARAMAERDWVPAGQGWQGKEAELRLVGWSQARRVVLLRRRLARDLAVAARDDGQLRLSFLELEREGEPQIYEFAVLVTSLAAEILTLAQLYRDRADCENAFDELKNHWGWGGFTTRDLKRCRLIAGIVALVYNWWSLFVRLADPEHHREVITSRPLLLHAVAQQSRHGRQTRITVSSMHARAGSTARALRAIAAFFAGLKRTAEQLTALERWCRILSRALVKYLKGRVLKPPGHLLPAPA